MLVSVYYFLPQPKGYLGVHSPPYGGGVGGAGHFYVFYYLCHYDFCPLCHYGFCIILSIIWASVPYVITPSVPLLLCLLHTLSPMSLCHSGSIIVNDFYELTNLSRNSKQKIGRYLPFLSRTFRKKFITIKNTIVYKIKQRRQNSENHKFICVRRTKKEMKERKNLCKKRVFVYIFHNKG